jgi:Fe-S-cluster-containing dehydrogenase component
MHRCIGCRYCIIACPYGSRSFNFRDPRDGLANINHDYATRTQGVVEKCSFCAERLARGEVPACVEAAGENGPLLFGDLSQEDSPIRQALRDRYTIRRKAVLGTDPHVFYVVA